MSMDAYVFRDAVMQPELGNCERISDTCKFWGVEVGVADRQRFR